MRRNRHASARLVTVKASTRIALRVKAALAPKIGLAAKAALGVLILLTCAESSFAREWRGIAPLRSTRADVVRLMNQCADHKEACRFTLGTDNVYILFSDGVPARHRQCGNALPPETVMFIEIAPRAKLKLADLHLDKRRLHHFNASDPPDPEFKGYSTDDGLMVSLFKGKVFQILYLPSELTAPPCFGYYSNPESFAKFVLVHVPVIYKLEAPETITEGEKLTVTAYSFINETRGYTWDVSAGKIVAGQYTKEVTIDTAGLAGQTLIVTAEIDDPFGHIAAASSKIRILSRNR